jgi:hypothetical protein
METILVLVMMLETVFIQTIQLLMTIPDLFQQLGIPGMIISVIFNQ